MSKSPDKISVGDVVRFIEGPTEPIACVKKGYSACRDVYKCVFKRIWQELACATSDIIDHVTFEDLAAQAGAAREVLEYAI